MRSFTEPPGLRYSTLASTSDAASPTVRLSLTSGVLPISSRREFAYFMRSNLPARRRRHVARPELQAPTRVIASTNFHIGPTGPRNWCILPTIRYTTSAVLRGRHAEMNAPPIPRRRSVPWSASWPRRAADAGPGLAGAGSAATTDPKYRKVVGAQRVLPGHGDQRGQGPEDLQRRHRGTDIKAPCDANVYATHPGIAQVRPARSRPARTLRSGSVSDTGGLVTDYAYLSRALVKNGQIIQSGQGIGSVGKHPGDQGLPPVLLRAPRRRCREPHARGSTHYVGQHAPGLRPVRHPRLQLASFNVLGASHTAQQHALRHLPLPDEPAGEPDQRTQLDVVGTQEFQDARTTSS